MSIKSSCLLSTCMAVCCATSLMAQTTLKHTNDLWHEGSVNETSNIEYNSLNPTRLSENKTKQYGVAVVDYTMQRGSYKQIDQAGKINDLNVYLGGLKEIGLIDLSGYLKYTNSRQNNRAWNATLYLHTANPFILGDSVKSDMTLEAFEMEATMAYRFAKQWTAGASIGLKAGSLSDQTDPRPKTNSSVIPIVLGVKWNATDVLSFGMTGRMDIYRSEISYTLVNPSNNHRYYLMQGMGAYYPRSSADGAGYSREYKGNTYTGALQLTYLPRNNNQWSNFLELSGKVSTENAEDGGSAYTFKGGDYELTTFGFQNRLQFKQRMDLVHHLILTGELGSGKGYGFDQKKMTDTEHGNRGYYVILSKDNVHKNNHVSIDLSYRLDVLHKKQEHLFFDAGIGMEQYTLKHFNDNGTQQQDWALVQLKLGTGKRFHIKQSILTTSAHGSYCFNGKKRNFGTGSIETGENDITRSYVLPQFEALSSKHVRVGGMLNIDIPIAYKNTALGVGMYAKIDSRLYANNGEYYEALKSTGRTDIQVGAYLKF